ncbi:zona pellucida-like domain-containing protein 1 [Sinocyclocheilus grahami]|uniref:zona pellucida-like domain-containing protein 1 n=1 Tax=Sinocyclocheilus grahami TaxID=75366 RepID=UPI0007AD4ADE|nr:PREDICTED: zona pellucida-like domain-containing protein 1 [Sinocyclocheilus grahami]
MNITSQVGSGVFSDFSQIQFVNVSGLINSWDPSTSTITYRQQLMYQFSCLYPLQYLVNNTELSVSGVSLAVKDNNGTFVSTLSMGLYSTADYTTKLQIPGSGLQLKTRIYVQVKATNLTNKFNVLLDRCYATTSPYPTSSTSYDLFIGCNRDAQTKIDWNGISQVALFSFEAFRFVEHKNRSISTFYLHCATRLCENSTCASLLPRCVRKREVQSPVQNSSDVATVSSGPISTRVDNAVFRDETDDSDSDVEEMDTPHPPSEAESEVPLTSDTAPTGPDDHTYYMLHSTVNSSKTELLLTELLGSDQPTRASYPFHSPLKINSTFPNPTGGVVPARLSSSASIPQLTYVGVATGLLSFFLVDWLSTSGLGQGSTSGIGNSFLIT